MKSYVDYHHEHCHWLHPCLLIYGVEKCWDSISIEVASSVHGLLSPLLWLVLHSGILHFHMSNNCNPDRFSHKYKSLNRFSILACQSFLNTIICTVVCNFIIYVYNREKKLFQDLVMSSQFILVIRFIICAILSLFSSRGYPPSLWCLTSSGNSPCRYEDCTIPASLTVWCAFWL